VAPTREDAVANPGDTGRPSSRSESDAVRNMERALAPLLGPHYCVRSGRVEGTGYSTCRITYSSIGLRRDH